MRPPYRRRWLWYATMLAMRQPTKSVLNIETGIFDQFIGGHFVQSLPFGG